MKQDTKRDLFGLILILVHFIGNITISFYSQDYHYDYMFDDYFD